MDNNAIIHGTLNDYIDYARLIEAQANTLFDEKIKVVKSRPSTKRNKNVSVNGRKVKSLTNRRKVLNKSFKGQSTN